MQARARRRAPRRANLVRPCGGASPRKVVASTDVTHQFINWCIARAPLCLGLAHPAAIFLAERPGIRLSHRVKSACSSFLPLLMKPQVPLAGGPTREPNVPGPLGGEPGEILL